MVALFTTAFHFNFPWPAQVYAVLNKYPNPLAPHVVSMDVIDRQMLADGTIRSERIIGISQDSPKWIRRLLGAPDVTYAREVSFIVPSCTANPSEPSPSPSRVLLEPPKLLMASTNLSLSTLLQCRETISYLPHPWPHLPPPTRQQFAPALSVRDANSDDSGEIPGEEDDGVPPYPSPAETDHPLSHPAMPPTTLFSQSALIFSTGVLATAPYPPYGISTESPVEPLSKPSASTYPQRAAGKRVEDYSQTRFEENAQGGRAAMEWAAGRLWREIETPEGGE
ncbi:hypothetical protein Rhopal_001173-T1 [Rhodotorula paludigena]|uniref:PRELI/MSF1 domain-containing protein n=1 Tax=Rhodotorula paludigena TaxID=86838 RepID=A0AAV5GHV7_9BASI|nr:hypothetical protein Rhopal_001173-T1 [Rhodotorula paludigena]